MLAIAHAIGTLYATLTPEQQKRYRDNIKTAEMRKLTFEQGCKVVIDLFVLHNLSLITIHIKLDMCEAELATEYGQGTTFAIKHLYETNPTGEW